jgi:NAD(P)H-nitrite reductase large subunit
MKAVTIIGAGVAGKAFAEAIRGRDAKLAITVIDKNNVSIARKDVIVRPADLSTRTELASWAQEKRLEFIHAEVEHINPRRRKIYFKEGEPKEFSTLILATGLCSRKLPIKGEHRDGFFYFSQLNPYKLRDAIKISQEAVVQASTWLGLQFAHVLHSLNLEVRVVARDFDFLGEYKSKILQTLHQDNTIVHEASQIEEAVGEGVVKAAKLLPLKVVSAQLVCIDSGFEGCSGFFESESGSKGEVVLEDSVYTNMEDIYFLGDVTRKDIAGQVRFIHNHEEALRQGREFAGAFMESRRFSFQHRVPDAAAIQEAYKMILRDTCPVSQKTED